MLAGKDAAESMKRLFVALMVTVLVLFLAAGAWAEEAVDITAECTFDTSRTERNIKLLKDRDYSTYWKSNKSNEPWVSIDAPADTPIHGVYVCFAIMPESWEIQIGDGEQWETYQQGDSRFLHGFVSIPEGAEHVRLLARSENKENLCINELYVLGAGDVPGWVQRWEPTHEKADILFVSTHPDDELIFFGGAIPTYAVEQQRKVVVAYFTHSNTTRSSELLNGLWHMGVRNYPVMGDFRDIYPKSVTEAYSYAGGKNKIRGWMTGLYRQFKPEVVVTQDTKGEYGHPQHKMVVAVAQAAIEYAADETKFEDSLSAYGTWQVKKLYLHLYKENQITFDWSVPLKSMNGATSLDLAAEAYDLYHISQHTTSFSVTTTGKKYDNRVFGLAYTTVGEDIRKDDFLENIYEPFVYEAE